LDTTRGPAVCSSRNADFLTTLGACLAPRTTASGPHASCNTALFVRRPAVRSSLPKSFFALSKPLLPCRNGEQFPPSSVTYAYFASKAESPYLFATCSVQSALKVRVPSLHPFADCLPTESCQQLATKYINSFVSANNWLLVPVFFLYVSASFFYPLAGRRDAAFFCTRGQSHFESLSFSLFQFSYCLVFFSLIPLRQFLQRSRFGNKHPSGTICLLGPQKTLFRAGEKRSRCCVR
jgi:hypothetical protein